VVATLAAQRLWGTPPQSPHCAIQSYCGTLYLCRKMCTLPRMSSLPVLCCALIVYGTTACVTESPSMPCLLVPTACAVVNVSRRRATPTTSCWMRCRVSSGTLGSTASHPLNWHWPCTATRRWVCVGTSCVAGYSFLNSGPLSWSPTVLLGRGA
jgi:hypothetical protein